ncbi:MAG: type III-A CRISPR-associated RAMP protein Csm5 [Muribaculaceae bacterium]|nr:type III-A CRISPR-associated RAMP protein Csm5 [Muribaculaceae bacterium]
MRHQVKIETLSSVHVGSGEKKVLGIDFLHTLSMIYFLDTLKIGESLNITSNPQLAGEWSKSVLAGKQERFFYEHNIDYKKYSRSVRNYVKNFSDYAPSISMMMRDGRGIAYVPGSSIKGAIRTAFFAQLAKDEIKNVYKKAKDKAMLEPNRRKSRKIVEESLKTWAKEFFGKISEDSFRFLRIGDAFFDQSPMVAVINTVQIKKSKISPKLADIDSIKQYAEVLLSDNSSEFILNFDEKGFSYNIPRFKDVKSMFKLINDHTKELVQSELNYWKDVKGAESLWNDLDYIDGEIEACHDNECVLRMGNASGKRFITGGILERINFDPEAIPKTRRIEILDDDSYALLGFVKLSLQDD